VNLEVDVAVDDHRVQPLAFAIVGDEGDLDVAMVCTVGSGVKLEVVRRDGESTL